MTDPTPAATARDALLALHDFLWDEMEWFSDESAPMPRYTTMAHGQKHDDLVERFHDAYPELLAAAEAPGRVAGEVEALHDALAGMGSVLWVASNAHNHKLDDFRVLLESAIEDWRRGYDALAALAEACPHRWQPSKTDAEGTCYEYACWRCGGTKRTLYGDALATAEAPGRVAGREWHAHLAADQGERLEKAFETLERLSQLLAAPTSSDPVARCGFTTDGFRCNDTPLQHRYLCGLLHSHTFVCHPFTPGARDE